MDVSVGNATVADGWVAVGGGGGDVSVGKPTAVGGRVAVGKTTMGEGGWLVSALQATSSPPTNIRKMNNLYCPVFISFLWKTPGRVIATLFEDTRFRCHFMQACMVARRGSPDPGVELGHGQETSSSPMALISFPKSTWLHPLYFNTSGRYVRNASPTLTLTVPLLLLGSPSIAVAPMVAMLVNA